MNQYVAALTLTELAPILTILAGMLVGFYGLLKFILTQSDKTSTADREERQAFMQTLDNLAKATDRNVQAHKEVATAVTKQAKEAEIRNGHLGSQNVEIIKLITSSQEVILDTVQNISSQHVDNQVIEQSTVVAKS